MIAETEWTRAVDALRDASEVAISCHVSPDGDAFVTKFDATKLANGQ